MCTCMINLRAFVDLYVALWPRVQVYADWARDAVGRLDVVRQLDAFGQVVDTSAGSELNSVDLGGGLVRWSKT